MIIERNQCVICDSEVLLKRTISNIPIHMGVKTDTGSDISMDQHWGECFNCGCVQLMNLLSPDVLYSVSHDPGSQGNIWKQHHQSFAEFILDGKPDAIFEIGGSNGNLAHIILNHIYDINYSILDPMSSLLDSRIVLHNMLFEDYEGKINGAVVHSHTIEHILNPKDFLQKLFNLMPDKGKMYMSFPNMEQALILNGTNALCFEHTYYLDIDQFKYLLEEVGFQIGEQFDFQSHSYFLQVIKDKNRERQYKSLKKNFNQMSIFSDMWDKTQSFVNEALLKLDDTPTYIFGAHIFSQALIALGLSHDSIYGVLDDAPSKIGSNLYGSDLMVYSSDHIANNQTVNVILRTGGYQGEIRNKLLRINPDVRIIE